MSIMQKYSTSKRKKFCKYLFDGFCYKSSKRRLFKFFFIGLSVISSHFSEKI